MKSRIRMCVCLCPIQKEAAIHRSKLRDGPFKLNLHPRDYFQGNPYHSDKPLSPAHKPLPPVQKVSPVPFKPPSPSKRVTVCSTVLAGSYVTCLIQSRLFYTLKVSLHVYVHVCCLRLEEWRPEHLTLIPHILLIHSSFAVPNWPIKSQSFAQPLVLKAHLWRVSSL